MRRVRENIISYQSLESPCCLAFLHLLRVSKRSWFYLSVHIVIVIEEMWFAYYSILALTVYDLQFPLGHPPNHPYWQLHTVVYQAFVPMSYQVPSIVSVWALYSVARVKLNEFCIELVLTSLKGLPVSIVLVNLAVGFFKIKLTFSERFQAQWCPRRISRRYYLSLVITSALGLSTSQIAQKRINFDGYIYRKYQNFHFNDVINVKLIVYLNGLNPNFQSKKGNLVKIPEEWWRSKHHHFVLPFSFCHRINSTPALST